MGTTTIDVIQSAQITALQDDVVELKDKLNAAVAELNKAVADIAELRTQEVNTITDITNVRTQVVNAVADITELRTKVISMKTLLNTVRTEVENLDDLITKDNSSSSGYSSSSNSGNGILKKIKLLEDACSIFMNNPLTTTNQSYWQPVALSVNPATQSLNPDTPLGTYTPASTSNESDPAAQTSSTPTAQSSSNPAAQTSANATNASVTGVYSATGTKVVTIQDDSATRAREVARSTLTRLRDI